ncbi:hypothetical protein CLOM_g19351 [Closterium sp. NIES-68]|nr:hypothetical protein CLOM_g19351 [Closterium sp. NIES-68]
MPFIEALRQFQFRVGQENFCLVHVSLVPVLGVVGEQKTKPTQHSVRELRALGLMPNLLACRSAEPLEPSTREKLSQFCHVPVANVLNLHDVKNIWHIPLLLLEQCAHLSILKQFQIQPPEPQLQEWAHRAKGWDELTETVSIAMVGKYTGLSDSYLSVLKALQHASMACGRKLILEWVASSDLEDAAKQESPDLYNEAWAALKRADGVLVPGGFGDRGVEGKILAANYARTNRIPYLGICLGMQIAVIEYARNVLGYKDASSTEFDPASPHPCIVFMPEVSTTHMGGTMRLGARDTFFHATDCLSAKLYGAISSVSERHRHRYEVNPDMIGEFEAAGLQFVGRDESGRRMEILEIPSHPYFVAVQYHPEFKSRPGRPSPVFQGLILAASGQLQSHLISH